MQVHRYHIGAVWWRSQRQLFGSAVTSSDTAGSALSNMNGQFLLNGPRFWNERESPRSPPGTSQMLTMAKIETPSRIEIPTKFEIPQMQPPRQRQQSTISTTSQSSSASSPQSKGSPASSTGDHWAQAMSSMFGADDECLACGYRYSSFEELADHQRINHGLAEVIF